MVKIKQSILAIVIGLALAASISFAVGTWSNPTANPTDGNTEAPINVGNSPQAKSGYLSLGTLTSPTVSLNVAGASNFTGIAQFIALATFNGGIKIPTDAGKGKILTSSDASGKASWQKADVAIQIEFAQGFRTESANRAGPIITIAGSPSAFAEVNNASPWFSSIWEDSKFDGKLDGVKCDDSRGWILSACWEARINSQDEDLIPYPNGCITNDYRGDGKAEISISCIRIKN